MSRGAAGRGQSRERRAAALTSAMPPPIPGAKMLMKTPTFADCSTAVLVHGSEGSTWRACSDAANPVSLQRTGEEPARHCENRRSQVQRTDRMQAAHSHTRPRRRTPSTRPHRVHILRSPLDKVVGPADLHYLADILHRLGRCKNNRALSGRGSSVSGTRRRRRRRARRGPCRAELLTIMGDPRPRPMPRPMLRPMPTAPSRRVRCSSAVACAILPLAFWSSAPACP